MNLTTRRLPMLALLIPASLCLAQDKPAAKPEKSTAPLTAKAPKRPLAVMPFAPPSDLVNRSDWREYSDRVTDSVVSALVDRNIPVVERARLGKLDNEQLLELNGQVERGTELGKKSGAHFMLFGSITNLKVRKRDIVIYNETTLEVRLRAQLVDIRSGEIVKIFTGEGRDTRKGITNPLESKTEGDSNVFEKAIDKASEDMAKKIAEAYPTIVVAFPAASGEPEPPTGKEGEEADLKAQLERLRANGDLKRITVMVVIPETHIQRRIPDPAAETEIIRQFTTAGFKVLDDKRVHELREDQWMRDVAHGNLDAAKLRDLKTRFGADLLVVGEGISERAENSRVGGETVLVRARVEVRIVRTENAEILIADGVHAPGRELSESLASKASLQKAGEMIAPRLIAAVVTKGFSNTVVKSNATIELEIGGWSRISDAQAFLNALNGLKGIKRTERKDYRGGVLFAEVEAIPEAVHDLAIWLESAPTLSRFGIVVDTSAATKITGAARKPMVTRP